MSCAGHVREGTALAEQAHKREFKDIFLWVLTNRPEWLEEVTNEKEIRSWIIDLLQKMKGKQA